MQWPCMPTYITCKKKHYQYNKRKPTLKLSYPLNSQMSAQINTTKYLIGKSPYGDIRAKVEYTLEKITLTLSYSSLAEILIRSNQPNLDTLNLRFIVEIEDDANPDDPTCIIVSIPEEIKYLSPSELSSLASSHH